MSLIPIIIPFVFSLLGFGLKGKSGKWVAFLGSLLLLCTTIWMTSQYDPQVANAWTYISTWSKSPEVSIALAVNGFSMVMILLSAIVLPFIIMNSWDKPFTVNTSFYGLVFLMIAAMNGVFLAKDGMLFYIFWEMALIPIYFICALWGEGNRIRVTLKFFIYTFAGSLMMLASLIFLYLKTPGNHSFAYEALQAVTLSGTEAVLIYLGFMIAFAIKMPLFPFHSWQADTYVFSPAPGTMLLSGIMLKMGTFASVVWMLGLAPEGWVSTKHIFIALAVFGVLYGAIIALRLKDIKRIFAWSSMSHVGLIGAGILTISETGIQGSFLQMFNHGINIVGLFFIADILERRFGTRDISNMGGIALKAPKFTALTMIIFCGAMAVPLTNGFPGELLLLKAIFQFNHALGVLAGLTIILCAVYMLRVMKMVFFGPLSPHAEDFDDLNTTEFIALGIIALLVLWFGLFPDSILQISKTATIEFIKMTGI